MGANRFRALMLVWAAFLASNCGGKSIPVRQTQNNTSSCTKNVRIIPEENPEFVAVPATDCTKNVYTVTSFKNLESYPATYYQPFSINPGRLGRSVWTVAFTFAQPSAEDLDRLKVTLGASELKIVPPNLNEVLSVTFDEASGLNVEKSLGHRVYANSKGQLVAEASWEIATSDIEGFVHYAKERKSVSLKLILDVYDSSKNETKTFEREYALALALHRPKKTPTAERIPANGYHEPRTYNLNTVSFETDLGFQNQNGLRAHRIYLNRAKTTTVQNERMLVEIAAGLTADNEETATKIAKTKLSRMVFEVLPQIPFDPTDLEPQLLKLSNCNWMRWSWSTTRSNETFSMPYELSDFSGSIYSCYRPETKDLTLVSQSAFVRHLSAYWLDIQVENQSFVKENIVNAFTLDVWTLLEAVKFTSKNNPTTSYAPH